MTPKEKAKELINKYQILPIDFIYIDRQDRQCIGKGFMTYNSAKEYALIEVDSILKEFFFDSSDYANRRYQYYLEVQAEIKKA